MPPNPETNDTDSAGMLREILSLAHPIMADAIYLAAIPHWYDPSLFTAVRNVDDKRNEGLIPRLQNYSFVISVAAEPEPVYRVRSRERLSLHRMWIDRDASSYSEAHRRVFNYLNWRQTRDDPTRDYEGLYHLFFVDLDRAANELIRLFQRYASERRLGAIEFLLDGVEEAYELLAYLHGGQQSAGDGGPPPPSGPPPLPTNLLYLAQLQNHLRARLAQMRGRWDESRDRLLELRRTPALAVELQPYVGRAYANLLRREGKFVQAIHELEVAIKQFDRASSRTSAVQRRPHELEQAMTLIALGDTYVEFARSVRGESRRDSVQVGMGRRLQSMAEFVVSLPLIIYLSFYLGRRVWHPHFWPTLFGLDWIVGRLFARGAQQFQRANQILEEMGTPEESVLADEKLAFLFLDMGDVVQANRRFSDLLAAEEAPLGPYRRILVLLGLADAQIQLQRPIFAHATLQEAIPKLEEYADDANLARAHALYAEASLFNGNYADAQRALAAAVERYQKLDEPAQATNVQERMESLAQRLGTPPAVQEAIQQNGRQLAERRYTSGYRHPVLVNFRRIVLLLMPLALILVFLSSIHLLYDIRLAPDYSFRAAPILNPADTQPTQLSQGITAATVDVDLNPRSLLSLALGALLIYLLGSAALGVWIILDAPLRAVQEDSQSSSISIHPNGLSAGTGEERQIVDWRDVTQLVQANTTLWKHPIASESSITVKATPPGHAEEQNVREEGLALPAPAARDRLDTWITIGGSTNWYGALQQRIRSAIPETAEVRVFDYSIFRSIPGAIYIANSLLFLLIALVAGNQVWGQRLWIDMPLTPYSIVDLYPYLYAGLMLLPLWWGIVRPNQIMRHTGGQGRRAQYCLIVAGVLAAFIISRGFRPLLTIPDLYPPLFVVITIASSAWLLWHLYPRMDRMAQLRKWSMAMAGLFMCVLMLSFVVRDVYAYHFLIFGNTERDQGRSLLNTPDDEGAKDYFERALENYERALQISEWPLWNIGPQQALEIPIGLPPQESFTWILALKNAAALHAQAGQGSRAVELYTQLLDLAHAKDRVYAWRAMALQRAVTQLSIGNGQEVQITRSDWYQQALADYEAALEIVARQEAEYRVAATPTELPLHKAQYTLWRGLTSHSLGEGESAYSDYEQVLALTATDALTLTRPYSETLAPQLRGQAMSGIGWLEYDRARKADEAQKAVLFRTAASWFEQAVEANPAEQEAWLGLGYARYSLGANTRDSTQALAELHEAERAWHTAKALDPSDPVVRISLGTLHWKVAGLASSTARKCEEYTQAIENLSSAVDPIQMRPQRSKEIAYSYRTMGYIYYELRDCAVNVGAPYADKEAVFGKAIESFSQAISYDPDVGLYHQMRGRLAYAHWYSQPDNQRDYQLLYDALRDLKKGAELGNPHTTFLNATLNALVPFALQQAETYIQAGELSKAQEQLVLVVENRTDETVHILSLLQSHLANPQAMLARRPNLDREELQHQLQEMIDELLVLAPAWSFDQAIDALADAEPGIAIPYFEIGLRRIQRQQDLASALEHLLTVSRMRISLQVRLAIMRQYRMALPQLEEKFIQNPTVESLITLASIAALLEDMERAGRLYAEAIRINAEDNNQQYSALRGVWTPLLRHWQATGSTASTLLAALDEQLNVQLAVHPALDDAEYYWGLRAWFNYWIGRAAFRAGDEPSAREALERGQVDADRAIAKGAWVGNVDRVHTYLLEGAWAWYHVERGDDRFELGDLSGALADYEAAFRENKADQDSTARSEKITAVAKAALTYVALDNMAMAGESYQRLLATSAAFARQDLAIQAGRDLRSYLLNHPEVDIEVLYSEFLRAEPAEDVLAQLGQPASYWRHRAEFELNVIYRVFLARPEDDAILLAVIEQSILDLQQAAELAPEQHAMRSEFFTNGIVGWLYRQRGNQNFEKSAFALALADYQTAVERTHPQGSSASEVILDAMLRAGIAALHLEDSASAAPWFADAFTLLTEQIDPAEFASTLDAAIDLLGKLSSENSHVSALRDSTILALESIRSN